MPVGTELARHACLPCRKSKRRCDKKIPSCDLCIKKDIDCNYPGARSSEIDSRTVYSQTPDSQSSPETTRPCNTEASAIYFLAPHLFRQAQLELPRSDFPIPAEVSSLIGDTSSIREIATNFFSSIHFWLPIVFKKGFFVSLLNPWTQRQTELSLLALCMKLCNTAPSHDDGPNNFLYRTAKHFYHEVETAGVLSTHVLQAGLLIALYEMGHGLYPAAYLTVGACARYGLALGIHKNCSPTAAAEDDLEMRGQRSWNEAEENRRVWWAVLIFDRFLNLNEPARPLSTEDPTFDTYLPVDDTSWNDCTTKPGDAVKISTGFSLKIGGFARLAQATYLLSQAFHSIAPSAAMEDDTNNLDQTVQLRRTLLALVYAADSEASYRRLDFCASSELSFSAILLLQQHSFQHMTTIAMSNVLPEISVGDLWPEAFEAVNRLISAATSYTKFTTIDPDNADCIPVFFTHVLYQVGCVLLMLAQGMSDEEIGEKLGIVKTLLMRVNARWRLAGIYADVLQAREIELASETHKTTRQFVCLT